MEEYLWYNYNTTNAEYVTTKYGNNPQFNICEFRLLTIIHNFHAIPIRVENIFSYRDTTKI